MHIYGFKSNGCQIILSFYQKYSSCKVRTTRNRKPDPENIYLDTIYRLIGAQITYLHINLGFGVMAASSHHRFTKEYSSYKVGTTWNRKPDPENIHLDTIYRLIGVKIIKLCLFWSFGVMAARLCSQKGNI